MIWCRRAAKFVYGVTATEKGSILARRPLQPRCDGDHCQPTLFIFVTTHPKELLQAMARQDFGVVFGNATASTVDAFINTAGPVKVWYNAHQVSPSGALAVARSDNSVWGIGPVYVVADEGQLHGLAQGQFADYVAMMALAEIKRSAHLGTAQTILRLFDGAPQAGPAGMSDWDREFLKMLYTPELSLASERSNIARRMIRELVP